MKVSWQGLSCLVGCLGQHWLQMFAQGDSQGDSDRATSDAGVVLICVVGFRCSHFL